MRYWKNDTSACHVWSAWACVENKFISTTKGNGNHNQHIKWWGYGGRKLTATHISVWIMNFTKGLKPYLQEFSMSDQGWSNGSRNNTKTCADQKQEIKKNKPVQRAADTPTSFQSMLLLVTVWNGLVQTKTMTYHGLDLNLITLKLFKNYFIQLLMSKLKQWLHLTLSKRQRPVQFVRRIYC